MVALQPVKAIRAQREGHRLPLRCQRRFIVDDNPDTFLAACTLEGIDCAVDCWGNAVCAPENLTPQRPVQPLDYAENLNCPLLGIFGNEDKNPTAEDVDKMEARLKELGKDYEFHRYDGAGHGIWYYHRPMYRQEQAMDSLEKVLAFFAKHLK